MSGNKSDEVKLFVEVTKSQYEEIKRALERYATAEMETNALLALILNALIEDDAGAVRITTQEAAHALVKVVRKMTNGGI